MGGRPDRPKLKSANRSEVTPQEFGAVALDFSANFGTWSVNEADKTLTQRLEGALNPNNEGTDVKNTVSLAGDELRLTGVNLVTGDRVGLVYRRAK
jgi:Lipocalin-like domain